MPFTLETFFAVEVGESAAEDLWNHLLNEFVGEEFAELQTAIESGQFTEEQIAELRENLTNRIEEILGPVRYLTVNIPLLSDIENAASDYLLGDEVEELRKFAAEFDLLESIFENACEAP